MNLLTQQDYLDRVASHLGASADPYCLKDLAVHLPSEESMARQRENLEGFLIDPQEGHAGLLELYDLADAQSALSRPGFKVQNWHYDRTAQVLLINLRRGVHEALSAALFRAYRPAPGRRRNHEEEAELFLSEGLGWFRSTSSLGRALKGEGVRLSAQERAAFTGIEFFEA